MKYGIYVVTFDTPLIPFLQATISKTNTRIHMRLVNSQKDISLTSQQYGSSPISAMWLIGWTSRSSRRLEFDRNNGLRTLANQKIAYRRQQIDKKTSDVICILCNIGKLLDELVRMAKNWLQWTNWLKNVFFSRLYECKLVIFFSFGHFNFFFWKPLQP